MHLERVEIQNFRSFKNLQVSLQSGLNVLVGRNNTGKTNLLHAIRHALGPSASRGDSIWLERDDFYRVSDAAEPESRLSVTLTFAGLSEQQRSHYFEITDFDLKSIENSKATIRFEASWPKGRKHATIRRTGGPISVEPPEVPTSILESLPVTYLPALRDAEAALAPGYRSRLASLLRDMATRRHETSKDEIVEIFSKANKDLEGHKLVSATAESLQKTSLEIAGTDHVPSRITAAEADFEKILRILQVQMKGVPVGSLSANGLGLNNLLYIAVVLEHLKHDDPDECPILLVEEPEAHLHPQLTTLLGEYLAKKTPGKTTPQTLVTTHSPTLAASTPPSRIILLCTESESQLPRSNSVRSAQMNENELQELQRMMDVTRATLYFAKAAILVEGISEALLLPILARRMQISLANEHISVIPICGVAFSTFRKLLQPDVLGIPVVILTDADPPVERKANYDDEVPKSVDGTFVTGDRAKSLIAEFEGHKTAMVSHSKVTLEYDLAEAGEYNADLMAEVWESCFAGMPRTFNKAKVAAIGSDKAQKALAVWRGVCRASPAIGKAEFAHRLSAKLAETDSSGTALVEFEIPAYIKSAIDYLIKALQPKSPGEEGGAG